VSMKPASSNPGDAPRIGESLDGRTAVAEQEASVLIGLHEDEDWASDAAPCSSGAASQPVLPIPGHARDVEKPQHRSLAQPIRSL
jgi:hypothetical protein